MACKKITKTNGSESELISTLESIFENEFKAEANYAYFESDLFKSEFGDYIEGYKEGDASFVGRVDENGEPKLFYNETAKKHYFINEKKEEVFYPLIKRGLRATFNYKQIDKIVSRLALNYFKKSKLDFNNIKFEEGETLPNLKDDIKAELIAKINQLKSGGLKEKMSARLLEKTLDNLDEYVEKVDAFYKQIGIKRVDNNNKADLETNNEDVRDASFGKQSFEKDVKDSLTTNMKLRLSLLTDTEDLDPIWGEPTFIGFNEAHGTLLNNITNQVANEGEDLFDLQRDQIKRLAAKKPYLKQLLSYMDNFTEQDKNQFAQAFNLHGNNFLVSQIKLIKEEMIPGMFKKSFRHEVIQISESGSKASIATSEWGNNFKKSFLNDKNKLSEESNAILSDVIDKLNALKLNLKEDLTPAEFEKFTNEYISLNRKLGVELTENGITNFLDENGKIAFDSKAQINKLSTSVTQTSIAVKKAITHFKKERSEYENPFDKEGVFKNLAKAEAFFMTEGSDSSIFSSGKNQWLFSYPSYLSTRILQWKKNPELLRNWYTQSAYNKGSKIMNYLLALDLDQNKTYEDDYVDDLIKERLENFRLGIFNSYQGTDEKGKDQQNDVGELSFKDYFNDDVNKVLANSYSRTTTPADKGSDLQIKTGFFMNSILSSENGEVRFTEETKETFFNYFNSEVNRMKEASAEVDVLKFTPEKLTINYHYKEGSKIDSKDGNAFKSQYFPELSFESDSKDDLVNQIKFELYNSNGSIKHSADLSSNEALKELIKEHVSNVLIEGVNQSLKEFLQQEILTINDEGNVGNKGIDSVIFRKYVEKNLLNEEDAAIEALSDYYINGLINNIEYSKMFTGDVAFYKNMIDYKKRVPATYSDGLQLRLKKGEEHFTVATIDKVEVGSPFYKELVEMLGKKGAKPYGLNEKGKGSINSADAQSWITPARWKFLIERLGKWTEAHDTLYEKMMSGKDEVFTAKEMKVAAQPLKGVYFYMNGKTPTYFKYSQAVLTPSITKNTAGLKAILDQMNDQGVDELITLDGFKVGSPTPTTIHNTNNTVKNNISFNTVQLSNYGWKLQQDLPVKGAHQTDVGSQIQKNVFAGLNHNLQLAGFDLDGKETNGQTISNNIVDVVSGLVDKGISDIKDEFSVFRNGEIKNIKGFYNALVSELERRGGSKNVIDALNKRIALYGMPQSMDKIISVFSSIMNDRLVKIKTNGGSFIQMSNFGISKQEGDSKGVIWNPDIENGTTTREPQVYTKANGRKGIKPAGILISGSFIAKLIPDYKTKYTSEELFKGKDGNPPIIDRKILETLVGYRIPNQGLSSNDALEIIGILPEENGDTIAVYTGMTTKTGSDFDIDKMYIMMPNFTLEDDRLKYTQYDPELSNKKQSKEALQNRLVELYKSVLTHPKVIQDVMKPLDNDVLKDDIIDLVPSSTSGTLFHFNAYNDIKLRYEFTNGKSGVGQEANAVVDINRFGQLSINRYKIGWGKVNEKGDTKLDEEYSEKLSEEDLNYYKSVLFDIKIKELEDKKLLINKEVKDKVKKEVSEYVDSEIKNIKIADSLTAILNAFVDIAKDPYITRGNWSTSTTNTGNLLVRAGVHPLYVTAFMAQPIIKEYVEYQASKESIITSSTGDIKNKFKKNLVINNLEALNEEYPELSKPLDLIYQKFIKNDITDFKFTATNAAERLDKLLGKKNGLSVEELEKILRLLKNEHNKVFNAEKIDVTDRSLFKLKDYRDQIKVKSSSEFQIAILDKFYELQEISKAVKENVDISKLDTNGMGKNVNSLFSTFNLLQHVLDKEKTGKIGVLNGMQSKFENTTLGVYHKGLKEILRIVQSNPILFPQASQKVQSMFNEISYDIYDSPAIEEEMMTDLEKAYYTYAMSNFAPFNFSSEEARLLLSRLPNRFAVFKKENKDKYFFLNELQIKNDGELKIITLNNRKKSTSFEEKFTDSWRDLITDNPELGEDLIKYSFLTSGFKMNSNQFFTYIPHEFLLQNNINQFVVNFSKEDQSDFIDKFYLNNSSKYKYVNKVFDSELDTKDITSGFILKKSDKSETGKAKYYVSRDAGGGVYKLRGYDSSNRAIYTRVKPLGKKIKGGIIVEYGDEFTKDTSEKKDAYIQELVNSVVTERDKYNTNFILDKIEDRDESDTETNLNIEELRRQEKAEMLSEIPNIEDYKVDGRLDKTLMPTAVLNKYEKIYDKFDKLIEPLMQKDNSVKTKVISESYGVVSIETNPLEAKTQEFVNLIQPQIQKQAYKENVGKDANDMFMYGLRWTRRGKAIAPLNNKSYANRGLPITDAKAKDGYVYDTVDQNGNPLAPISDLQPIISEIQDALGLDMSDYDAVIGNIYLPGQNISTHRDTTESLSAKNYPVVVYTIGNNSGISIYENEKEPGSASFASDKQTTIPTKNGSIYTFGMDGKGRFEVAHDTPKGIKRDVNFPPITMPNGNVITNYTITLTFRRAADLQQGMATQPAKFDQQINQPSETQIETVSEPITSMSEITNHSGGAYGADTMWDVVGRTEFGVTQHNHYREGKNANLTPLLKHFKVKSTEVTSEQMEAARQEVKKLLGIEYKNDLRGNLQVRNYYQVANADAVFAIASLDIIENKVKGGTNTAVQLGLKLNKPTYVWDINTEKWYLNNGFIFEEVETPILTKDFAGVGTRDIENYSVPDKVNPNKWVSRKEYVGNQKAKAAEQAIREVYQKTKDSISGESKVKEKVEVKPVAETIQAELKQGQYVKYNGETYIITKETEENKVQIYNPNIAGPKGKLNVLKSNLTAVNGFAKIVSHLGVNYIVTPNKTIISTATYTKQNWDENNGVRKAILAKADNDILAPKEYELETAPLFKEDLQQKTGVKPNYINTSTFKPANKEQEIAIEAIKDFIEKGNSQEIFILEGKAGTGKTTLVQEALADSVAKGKRIHIAALSHKAKLVLAQKLNQRFPNRINSSSIAGLLGMKMNEETGEFEPGFAPDRPIESADIIVIDEASMVNEEALSLIMQEKRRGAKVIFLGDRGQLPPIRKISSDEISAVFESQNKASLIERVRQGEESPILPFADYFWDNSESEKPKANPIPEGQIKDSLTDKGNLVFINSLFDVFEDVVATFKKGIDSRNFNVIKIVTYKNATRQNYNKEIRKSIFGQDVAQFVEKDQIMFQNNYSSNNVEFSNSDEFSIETVVASEKNGYKVFDIGVKIDPNKDIITYFPVLAEEDKSKFNEEVSRLFEVAKKMSAGQARKIAYQKAWSLKATFAEIDYSYAITSHKSQGSTYDNVIVDLKDIYSVGATTNASKSRSAYTGLTRAKNTAIIITSKAETNNDNVKKSLAVKMPSSLTEEEQNRVDELKKYCNPG